MSQIKFRKNRKTCSTHINFKKIFCKTIWPNTKIIISWILQRRTLSKTTPPQSFKALPPKEKKDSLCLSPRKKRIIASRVAGRKRWLIQTRIFSSKSSRSNRRSSNSLQFSKSWRWWSFNHPRDRKNENSSHQTNRKRRKSKWRPCNKWYQRKRRAKNRWTTMWWCT